MIDHIYKQLSESDDAIAWCGHSADWRDLTIFIHHLEHIIFDAPFRKRNICKECWMALFDHISTGEK